MAFELPKVGPGDAAHAAESSGSGASGAVGLERDFRRSAGTHAAGDSASGTGASGSHGGSGGHVAGETAGPGAGATGAHTLPDWPLPAPKPTTNFSRPFPPQPAVEPAHVEEPAHAGTPGVVGQANDHGFNAAPQTEAGHVGAGATAASQPSRVSRWADRNKGFGDALDKALKPYTVPLTVVAGVSGLAIAGTALGVNINKKG